MKERIIQALRNEIARLRDQIAQGNDTDGAMTRQADALLQKLDQLTEG